MKNLKKIFVHLVFVLLPTLVDVRSAHAMDGAVIYSPCSAALSHDSFRQTYADWVVLPKNSPTYPVDKTIAILFSVYKGGPTAVPFSTFLIPVITFYIVEGKIVEPPAGMPNDPSLVWVEQLNGKTGYVSRGQIEEIRVSEGTDPSEREFELSHASWSAVPASELNGKYCYNLAPYMEQNIALFMRYPNGRTQTIVGVLVETRFGKNPKVVGGGRSQEIEIAHIQQLRVYPNIRVYR